MRVLCGLCAGVAVTVIILPVFVLAFGLLAFCYLTALLIADDWML